jgi:hypothetical protein
MLLRYNCSAVHPYLKKDYIRIAYIFIDLFGGWGLLVEHNSKEKKTISACSRKLGLSHRKKHRFNVAEENIWT